MIIERKRPWQLIVVATLFVIFGAFAIYAQVGILQSGLSRYRADVLFLPIGLGLLLRWRFCRTLAQLALVVGYAVCVVAFLGVPFGFTHIEYAPAFGPQWVQLLVILLLVVVTTLVIHWMFRVTLRADVRSWFERIDEHAG